MEKVCPTHNRPLREFIGKKSGKKYWKCTFKVGENTWCDVVNWGDSELVSTKKFTVVNGKPQEVEAPWPVKEPQFVDLGQQAIFDQLTRIEEKLDKITIGTNSQ